MVLLDSPICEFGWQAPDFVLKDAYGDSYSMWGAMGERGLLIAFICNHCPYVKAIAKPFSEDAKKLSDEGVSVLAVMSNDFNSYPEDSPNNMLRFAAQHKFSYPYLIDVDQAVAKQYDAVCTPDFFGLNNKGELQYRGRLDNLSMHERNRSDRIPELLNAMRQVAQTAKGPEQQIASMGCSIKWRV